MNIGLWTKTVAFPDTPGQAEHLFMQPSCKEIDVALPSLQRSTNGSHVHQASHALFYCASNAWRLKAVEKIWSARSCSSD